MRPREFNEEIVLQTAFERFWRHGVRATSLTDIARETGVLRGSLYNAYGSKEALFLRAYERYASDYIAKIEDALSKGSLRQRLGKFFSVAIANFAAGSPPPGCPTTRGLMEVSAQGEGLDHRAREAFASLLSRLTELLEAAFAAGRVKGEFRGKPRDAALHILTLARGLVVLERAYGDEAELHGIAKRAVDLVLSSSSG